MLYVYNIIYYIVHTYMIHDTLVMYMYKESTTFDRHEKKKKGRKKNMADKKWCAK